MLLVLVKPVRLGQPARIDADTAREIFSALGESVREADFIGWFRQHRVAGAVLIQPPGSPDGIREIVTTRMINALRGKQRNRRVRFRVFAVSLKGKRKG